MWLFVLSLSNILAAIGITIVVPLISGGSEIFGVDQSTIMWIMSGFMLSYASFMPIFGKLSDIFGRKKVFVFANFILALGLLISSVLDSFVLVVIGRMIQGFGAGGILPVANALAVEMMEDKKEKALAIVNATYGLGMILGVNLGGFLYGLLGWKSLFQIPFYLSLLAGVLCVIFLKDKGIVTQTNRKIDYIGSVLFATSMILFLLFMNDITHSSITAKSTAFVVGSIVSLISFIFVELKTEEPAINLHLFKNKNYLVYNILALFFGTTMFITITFLAPYAQLLLNLDVSTSVYAVDPMALVMTIAIALSGILSRKIGSKSAMFVSSIVLVASTFLFSYYAVSALPFYILSMLVGLGIGLMMTPINHIVIEEAGEGKRGEAAGIVSIMRSIGGVLGPAFAGIILANTDFSSIFAYSNILASYQKIFEMAGWFAVAILALSVVGMLIREKKTKGVVEYEEA